MTKIPPLVIGGLIRTANIGDNTYDVGRLITYIDFGEILPRVDRAYIITCACSCNVEKCRHINIRDLSWIDSCGNLINLLDVVNYMYFNPGSSGDYSCPELGDHIRRIQECDPIRWPPLVDSDFNVIDGCHRIAKYYLQHLYRQVQNIHEIIIDVRVVHEDDLQMVLLSTEGK